MTWQKVVALTVFMTCVWHVDLVLSACLTALGLCNNYRVVSSNGFWEFSQLQIYHGALYGMIASFIYGITRKE